MRRRTSASVSFGTTVVANALADRRLRMTSPIAMTGNVNLVVVVKRSLGGRQLKNELTWCPTAAIGASGELKKQRGLNYKHGDQGAGLALIHMRRHGCTHAQSNPSACHIAPPPRYQ
jgi:hypothetical protein